MAEGSAHWDAVGLTHALGLRPIRPGPLSHDDERTHTEFDQPHCTG